MEGRKEKGGRGGRGEREGRRKEGKAGDIIETARILSCESLIVQKGKERATITILVLDSNISRLRVGRWGGGQGGGVTYKQRKDLSVRLGLLGIQYGQLRRGCLLKGSRHKSASYSSLLKLRKGDKAYHG